MRGGEGRERARFRKIGARGASRASRASRASSLASLAVAAPPASTPVRAVRLVPQGAPQRGRERPERLERGGADAPRRDDLAIAASVEPRDRGGGEPADAARERDGGVERRRALEQRLRRQIREDALPQFRQRRQEKARLVAVRQRDAHLEHAPLVRGREANAGKPQRAPARRRLLRARVKADEGIPVADRNRARDRLALSLARVGAEAVVLAPEAPVRRREARVPSQRLRQAPPRRPDAGAPPSSSSPSAAPEPRPAGAADAESSGVRGALGLPRAIGPRGRPADAEVEPRRQRTTKPSRRRRRRRRLRRGLRRCRRRRRRRRGGAAGLPERDEGIDRGGEVRGTAAGRGRGVGGRGGGSSAGRKGGDVRETRRDAI